MRRIVVVLSLSALLVTAMAVPAFADKGGFPSEKSNNNACHGQWIRGDNIENGLTPAELADSEGAAGFGIENAGEHNKVIKNHPLFCNTPG